MIEDQHPEDALRRLLMHNYDDDAEWIAEVRRATRMEEYFKERRSLLRGGFSNPCQREKRKAEVTYTLVPAKKAKTQYTVKEKAGYKKKKAVE